MKILSIAVAVALSLSSLAFAKGGTPKNHHCVKDGATVEKTKKDCIKDGGTWEKNTPDIKPAPDTKPGDGTAK